MFSILPVTATVYLPVTDGTQLSSSEPFPQIVPIYACWQCCENNTTFLNSNRELVRFYYPYCLPPVEQPVVTNELYIYYALLSPIFSHKHYTCMPVIAGRAY